MRNAGSSPDLGVLVEAGVDQCAHGARVPDRRDPDISPLYADLNGLPPALFSVGTKDMLLDDSLFMASRWVAAGNTTDLAIWPGGCHVFIRFDSALSKQALSRIDGFIERL